MNCLKLTFSSTLINQAVNKYSKNRIDQNAGHHVLAIYYNVLKFNLLNLKKKIHNAYPLYW